MASTTIQIRIDSADKRDASKLFRKLGTDLSSATKMFLKQSVRTKTLAVKGLTENGFTEREEARILKALKESYNPRHLSKPYKKVDELFRDLNKQ